MEQFNNYDMYSTAFFDLSPARLPQACKDADPNLPYCMVRNIEAVPVANVVLSDGVASVAAHGQVPGPAAGSGVAHAVPAHG